MRASRILSGSIGTVLVGALTGFILASALGVVVQDTGLLGNGESTVAHTYMLGLLQQDPGSITSIRPNRDIAQRAMELQGAEQRSTAFEPLSLTYLGGASAGKFAVHIYAVGLRSTAGVDQFFPLALTVSGGKVIRRE